jgi:hypothetical protein
MYEIWMPNMRFGICNFKGKLKFVICDLYHLFGQLYSLTFKYVCNQPVIESRAIP